MSANDRDTRQPPPHWSDALAAALLEETDDAIIARSLDGLILSWNRGAVRLFGYTADEMHGASMQALIPEDCRADDAAAIAAVTNDVALRRDTRRVRKDGSIVDVAVTLSSVRDAAGAPAALAEICRDNTERKSTETKLRASEAFLDRAVKVAGLGGWSMTIATGAVYWSDQVCRIHEVERGHQPTLEQALQSYTPEGRVKLRAAVDACIDDGTPYDIELPLNTAAGRRRWVRATGEIDAQPGQPLRLFGTLQDVTGRRTAQADVAEQFELMRVTLDSISDAVITTDDAADVLWLNPAAVQITGWTVEGARGQPIEQVFRVINEYTREGIESPVRRTLAQGIVASVPEHTVLLALNGREYGIQDSSAPIRNAAGTSLGAVLIFRDVTTQRLLAREVSYRASRDALTGVLNRSEFEVRLKQVLAGAHSHREEHALMFIDLDQFKVVNDTCGHAAGDEMLRQIAGLFQSAVRSHDTLARLGGDEFGLIMEHCTTAQARRAAEQLCQAVERFRFMYDGRPFRVGTSIGLVPVDRRWLNTTTLLQAADSSCYAAKEAGRSRVHEWADTDHFVRERQGEAQWVTRIEQALEQGRLVLYGQRIAPCATRAEGLNIEVLLRLVEADGTVVPASAFIPAAERFHIASRIDRWVVGEVLKRLERLPAQGVETLAVNLSGQSISDQRFCHEIAEQLSTVQFDASKLCFEITETAAITHMEAAREFVEAMHSRRVKIALDDFGAGASSFGYLKNLKIDYLKIDGQFVRDLLEDPLDQTAVRCFRDVAAVCNVRAVAESVESQSVFEELRRIGVDFAQGHLVHAPQPLDELLAAFLS